MGVSFSIPLLVTSACCFCALVWNAGVADEVVQRKDDRPLLRLPWNVIRYVGSSQPLSYFLRRERETRQSKVIQRRRHTAHARKSMWIEALTNGIVSNDEKKCCPRVVSGLANPFAYLNFALIAFFTSSSWMEKESWPLTPLATVSESIGRC